MNRTVLALVIAALPLAPAAARDSLYTSLKPPACKSLTGKTPAQVAEHEALPYSCPGIAGWTVFLTYHGTNVTAALARDGGPKPAAQLGAPFDIGPRMEWRGTGAGRGFKADTVIVRLTTQLDAMGKTGSVLAVAKIGPDGICLAGVVDAQANRDANTLARGIADDPGLPGFRCGTDLPRVVGPQTELTKEALERMADLAR